MTVSIKHHRSIWISDVHLGTRGCKADLLLDFLKNNESEYLYLVGDILDCWRLKKSWYWTQEHNDIVQKILRKARKGTKVFYIPGNHDEALRDYAPISMGGISIVNEAIHTMLDGRRFLTLHGDQFDSVIRCAKWLALLGDHAYDFTIFINHYYNILRRKLGYSYWSLSAYLKHKVKNAVNFISAFEHAVVQEARKQHVDGVICGHIHKPEILEIQNITYANGGDWVENCTALVEACDGELQIIHWTELMQHPSHQTIPVHTEEIKEV